MELEITSLNHNGEGIGRIDNKVIFIPKTIPGDVITIKNMNDYKNYKKAEVDKYIKRNNNIVKSPCKYYKECGGCQIMEIPYDEQLKYKQEKLKNIFKKYSDISIDPDIEGCNQYNYRNKITLQVQNNKIGLFKHSTNEIVPIDKCLLVNENINDIINIIKEKIDLTNIEKITIKTNDKENMIIIYGKTNNLDITPLKQDNNSIYINDLLIYGKENITINLNKYKFNISSESFFQVNNEMTIKLYNFIKENISKSDTVLDLYCGVGSIGIYCSELAKQIIGIEINKQAIENANTNKLLNNIDNIKFICKNANKISYNEGMFDTVIVDPPRGGLDKKTINIINNLNSKKVIYVSCNPITLARDINILKEKKKKEKIKLFDMFPNTYHIETVCVLDRKN